MLTGHLIKDIKNLKFNPNTTQNVGGSASRNSTLNRKDMMSTNMWKPTAATMPPPPEPEEVPVNAYAFGSGHFFEGLNHEIKMLENEDLMMPSFEPAKYSSKRNGIIASYGANTN